MTSIAARARRVFIVLVGEAAVLMFMAVDLAPRAVASGDSLSGRYVQAGGGTVTMLTAASSAGQTAVSSTGLPALSVVAATSPAVAEMQFAGGSACALHATVSTVNGQLVAGQVVTRAPAGAVLSLDQGLLDCTVSKAPQYVIPCDDAGVSISAPSVFTAICDPGQFFGVVVSRGRLEVMAPNGTQHKVRAGEDLSCGPANCAPIARTGAITQYRLPSAHSQPTVIAEEPGGSLWFTEPPANRIGKITPAGHITQYRLPARHSYPSGIAAGPGGDMWFTDDSVVNKIGKISPNGTITQYSLPLANGGPRDIAAGPDGNVVHLVQCRPGQHDRPDHSAAL